MGEDQVTRLEHRVQKRRAKVEETLVEKGRLKWLHLILVGVPVGAFWAWWIAAWVAFAWITFWGVGAYMNYFHLREARTRLSQAEAELSALRRGA